MPKLTIAAGATTPIPATKWNGLPASRKALVFTLVSGDAYWGWTPTVTAAGNTDAGIGMVVDEPVSMHSQNYDFSAAVNIFSPSGCVINYQTLEQ